MQIIQYVFGAGGFSWKWKNANLVRIHKSDSKSLASNYRGISFLDVLSKLLEKQVYIEISGNISTYIAQWQYGFLPGRSTMSQLSQVVRQFARALEMRQQIVVIYLDFSKAFDRVPHEKLLFKLECLGIKGSLLAWFRSYLSGRRHRVMIDNEASDFLPVTSGVPQGSIIGPLLFLIYINDRVPGVISENTSLPLFAAAPSIKAVKFSFSIVVYTVGLVTKSVLACGDTRKKRISERPHFF